GLSTARNISSYLSTHYSNSLSAGADARRQATTELRGAKQPPITCRVTPRLIVASVRVQSAQARVIGHRIRIELIAKIDRNNPDKQQRKICPLVKERSLRPLHSLSASVAGGPSINYEFRVRVEVVSYEVISDTFYAFSHTAYVYGLLGSE
ncbi:hypothetical protein BHE74_00039644, partial [Ensete ventricosum]